MKPRLRAECTVSSEQELILASCCLSQRRRNSVFGVLRVKKMSDIQEDIVCKGVCEMRNIAVTGKDDPLALTAAAVLLVGVVLRHRDAAVASLSLTVDAAAVAAYTAHRRPHAAEILGLQMIFCTTVSQIPGFN